MLSFLDLSTATEEERCSINEILSDTSVVNFAEPLKKQLNLQTAKSQPQNHKSQSQLKLQQNQPQNPQQLQQQQHHPHHHHQHQHQQQPRTLKSNNSNNNRLQHRHQHHPNQSHQNNYHNQHQPHPSVNNVISVDVSPTQPAGYAVPPIPQQAHGFGPPPPPPPHHVYRGPPIFQPYPAHYFIPYNLPPYPLPPILLPPNNSVVPNRQQQQQQSDEAIKISPGGAIDVQTNLNVSKQFCSNSSDGLRPGASSGDCNDSGTEQSTQEPRESNVRAENT